MSEETMRKNERKAYWMIWAICLAPLVPYALRGAG